MISRNLRNEFIRWYFNEFSQDTLFKTMNETCENSPWHREDNVGIHTNMVVAEFIGLQECNDWDSEILLGALACAFHDVGKPAACDKNGIKFKPERGNYLSFGGHEQISARLWEDYAARNWARLVAAFDLRTPDIYIVSWMVEYHLPWGIKKDDKLNSIAKSAMFNVTPEIFCDVLLADTLGRISEDAVEKRAKVNNWINTFLTDVVPRQQLDDIEPIDGQPVLVIPIGASGTGKSTYRSSLTGFSTYSWDDLRLEFYSADYKEAYQMSVDDSTFGQRVNARFMEMVKSGVDIYVDNTNLSKKRRAFCIGEARRRGYFIRAVLFPVSLSEVIARQETRGDKNVPVGAVIGHYMAIQSPQYGEFDDIVVMKSNLPTIT